MRPFRFDIACKSDDCAAQGELLRRSISKSRRHGTPDKKVAKSFMPFAFYRVEWLAGAAVKMWAKTISSFKYMQIGVELLPLQVPTLWDSYVPSEMRDKSSTDCPLLRGFTTPGSITPIGSRRARRKGCTQEVSPNGCTQSTLELHIPIVRGAWRRFHEGGEGGLPRQA